MTSGIGEVAPGRQAAAGSRLRVVVVGNGMVGQRFCDLMTEGPEPRARVATFCEEPYPAYDRVHLSEYFGDRGLAELTLEPAAWYASRGIELWLGERVDRVDRARKRVVSSKGREVPYDALVLATGSYPFVPPITGRERPGVFVYRTIDDLEAIQSYARGARTAAVIGGGLLGLEAAKAAVDLGLSTTVVEFAPRLMPRQLDAQGAKVLQSKIEDLGIQVLLGRVTTEFVGRGDSGPVEGLAFKAAEPLAADLVIVSAGIRPRDDLAEAAGLKLGPRGGISVNDQLQTSDPSIYAIGECALHQGMVYGLVGPGYQMAEVVRDELSGRSASFDGADLSTKLKLLGVDVASFGDALSEAGRTVEFTDRVAGVYKKLVVDAQESRVLGGILVGDASDYMRLLEVCRTQQVFEGSPEDLLFGGRESEAGLDWAGAPDSTQVCSCNNVSKGQICAAVIEQEAHTVGQLKSCTRAGSGCGGCVPLVADILNAQLARIGLSVKPALCEHFAYTRQELYQIVKVRQLRTFPELLAAVGRGHGCEICKPAVASILASVFNEFVVQHDVLQDTNDRYLANIQRGGLYSVVPRVAGGEITPRKLIALGRIAEKYGLYSKITGGQRIDLFGAKLNQLPEIWEELVAEGFESGHAYGKALRTVKSCVGTTWCRFGVQDSVGFAIRVEERYRGIRSPHKLKGGVSGCVRECAEAQSKDFGIIATDKGWNLYVCGNGGARPRHADLLAGDLDEPTCIRYLDRFLMYYIATADKLTRTSVWLEKLEGGLQHLKQVVIEDSLGLCEQLERDMQHLVDTYRCEWKEVVENPEARAKFAHYANSAEPDTSIQWVDQRGQRRPADWPAPGDATVERKRITLPVVQPSWVKLAPASSFPVGGGRTIQYGSAQVAVFNFERDRWYATQNKCPHRKDMVLSRGLIGDQQGVPKVACPLHKKSFSLEDGSCLSEDDYCIATFPVREEGGWVYVELPDPGSLERMIGQEECGPAVAAE